MPRSIPTEFSKVLAMSNKNCLFLLPEKNCFSFEQKETCLLLQIVYSSTYKARICRKSSISSLSHISLPKSVSFFLKQKSLQKTMQSFRRHRLFYNRIPNNIHRNIHNLSVTVRNASYCRLVFYEFRPIFLIAPEMPFRIESDSFAIQVYIYYSCRFCDCEWHWFEIARRSPFRCRQTPIVHPSLIVIVAIGAINHWSMACTVVKPMSQHI